MRKLLPILTFAIVLLASSCVRDRGPVPIRQYSFVDEFDDDRNQWGFSDAANYAYGTVFGGRFAFDYNDNLSEVYYVSKYIGFNRFNDFTIYTRIGSDNNMGLLFGYNATTGSYGYSFMIDRDGYYAFYDEGGNGYGPDLVTLVAPTTNGNVNINGDYNELKIEQIGSRWIGYVNNYQVFNIEAQNLKGTNVGFVDAAFTKGDADYLQVDWLQ